MSRASCLLIDLDGVIRIWPPREVSIEEQFGLPPETIKSVVFEPTLLTEVVTGIISDPAWRAAAAEVLRTRYAGVDAKAIIDLWSEPTGVVDATVLDLLWRLDESVRVLLVTNATSRLREDLAALHIADRFHAVVNSSEVGIAKPDEGIFRHALALAGAAPAESLFVDDSAPNVQSASKLGIRSLHYTDHRSLANFLESHGVLK